MQPPRLVRTRSRAQYKQGAQWRLPSIDTVVFAGPGAAAIKKVSELGEWFQASLKIATQPQTRAYGYDLVEHLGDDKLICARRGAVVGSKYRLFTSRADHWLFRAYGYREAGLIQQGVQPHSRYPPRKITVLDRESNIGRAIFNKKEVEAVVRGTGLPYEYVGSLGRKSFTDQVTIMSQTGILIGPHGAGLANSIFLPAHAVVVELFSIMMKKWSYSNLAATAGLLYFPVYGWDTLPANYSSSFYGVQLMQDNYFKDNCLKTNISSYDANTMHACNSASKYHPVIVPIDTFRQVLKDAVDAIGAYSPQNPAWQAALAKAKQEGAAA